MEPLHDWRSPQFEEELSRLDRGGVAFEFLRRNKGYRQDFADTLARVASGGADKGETIARLSRRWGLVFPGGPVCFCTFRAAIVVATALSCRGHCHACPFRFCGKRASRP